MNYKVESQKNLKHDVPESQLTFKVAQPNLARKFRLYQEYVEIYRETLNMFPCLLGLHTLRQKPPYFLVEHFRRPTYCRLLGLQ
jgi:hypothetical protein